MTQNRLFGADGIRSSVDRFPLTAIGIADLGRAFAEWLRVKQAYPNILLGADTRESSHRVKSILIDSLLRYGVSVVDSGIIPTPGLSYILARKGFFHGGVMISASHNPVAENGLKFFNHRGCKLSDQDEKEIEERFSAPRISSRPSFSGHLSTEPDYVRQYAVKLTEESQDWGLERVKLLIDCANGAASHVVRMALDLLNIQYMLMNAMPNGANINRDAGSESVRQAPDRMIAQIRHTGAEIGLALDGDGDRVVVVDNTGTMFDGDMLLAAFGFQLSREARLMGSKIVTTQAANSGLSSFLRRHGITTYLAKNGDKYVTEALLAENLSLGGEQIGHIIIHDHWTNVTGDGLRTALFLLKYLAQNPDAKLRDLAPGMRKFPQIKASVYIGRRTEIETEEIPGLSEQLALVRTQIPDLAVLECRPASTEPVYRIIMEARQSSVAMLAHHAYQIGEQIQAHFARLDLPIYVLDCVTGGNIQRRSIQQ
jgi:phosphoglucosamine mutase